MDSASLDADAGSDGVDAVVIAFNGYLGALAVNACHILMVMSPSWISGTSCSEKTAEEAGIGAAYDNLGIIVGVVNSFYDCGPYRLYGRSLPNLFFLGHDKLVLFFVEKKHLAFPDLMNLTCDDPSPSISLNLV